jgi:aryl-alcohol dehydrogenase-like predicted oxidoreductase
LGCWQFAGGRGLVGAFWGTLSPEQVRAIVEASLESGVDWFDTAEIYGNGASERALARALSDLGTQPDQVVIATKWNPAMRTSPSIRETFSRREECLRPFPVALHQVHHPFGLSPVEAEMRVMANLIDRERIRAVGVSNFSAAQMRRAHDALVARGHVLATNQVRMSLIDRSVENNGVLEMARELGVSLIAYSPLEQGLLTGKYHRDPELIRRQPGGRRLLTAFGKKNLERTLPLVRVLESIAEAHDTTAARVALAWVLQFHGDLVVAIPGARSADQAKSNAAAARLVLTEHELDRLDRVSKEISRP